MAAVLFFELANLFRKTRFWIKEDKPFPINNLPRLALNEVMRSMNRLELVKLAVTSKRMAISVKRAKIRLPMYRLCFGGELSCICLPDEKAYLFCGNRRFWGNPSLLKTEMREWCRSNSVIENLSYVVNRLQYIFICDQFAMLFSRFDLGEIQAANKPFIEKSLKSCEKLYLCGNRQGAQIRTNDLCYILETSNPEARFILSNLEVPIDFQSDFAFKFQYTVYSDARWVKIEHLHSLRNQNSLFLKNTNLTTSDFNSLIECWVKKGPYMFSSIHFLGLKEDPILTVLFKDLLVLCVFERFGPLYYVASKRDRKLLMIDSDRKSVYLRELSVTTKIVLAPDVSTEEQSFEQEFEILQILARRERLQEIVMAEMNDAACDQKLEVLRLRLVENRVEFENGMATITR